MTGAPLKGDDLISLIFHKNSEGEYHCPVLNKVFTKFTYIIAVKTTGNVFCYELAPFDPTKKKKKKKVVLQDPVEESTESQTDKSDSLPVNDGLESSFHGLKKKKKKSLKRAH